MTDDKHILFDGSRKIIAKPELSFKSIGQN